jgi:hypothetical protein
MKYLKIDESEIITESKSSILEKICCLFFSKKISIEKVSYWLLEIDENGIVNKEISIGVGGEVLSIAPKSKNRGEWVDSNMTLNYNEYEQIDSKLFQDYWNLK